MIMAVLVIAILGSWILLILNPGIGDIQILGFRDYKNLLELYLSECWMMQITIIAV